MSQQPRCYHHGESPAAWTGVAFAGIGFLLGTISAFTWPNWTLAIVAGCFMLVGVIAAGVLKKLGYGNG